MYIPWQDSISRARGKCSPLRSPPGVNTLYCLEEWRGEQRISPSVDTFTPRGEFKNGPLSPGDEIHLWGSTSPLEVKLAPRGDAKNGPQGNNVYLKCKSLGWGGTCWRRWRRRCRKPPPCRRGRPSWSRWRPWTRSYRSPPPWSGRTGSEGT
jgi:hypothetical protein